MAPKTTAADLASPERFAQQVRDALVHLYDPAYLQTHPLAALVERNSSARSGGVGKALRVILVEAIDSTRPLGGTQGFSSGSVIHAILTLRYVEALEPAVVQERLTVGRSEYYREHQKGVEAVISLLWEQWGVKPETKNAPTEPQPESRVAEGIEVRPARHNLPNQLTSFVGRQRELADVVERLGKTRLLTVTGAGGCGKTRLTLEVAASLLDSFPDGTWFVDLAPLTDPILIVPTIMSTIGVTDVAGRAPLVSLSEYFGRRSSLLVLDNCEHLIDASARLAEALLQSCPRLRILATSREMLGAAGELAWRVPSLSLPDSQTHYTAASLAGSEAIELFVERARMVQPSFILTDDVAGLVAQICGRLDGIPFAIELAAARTRMLTIGQIATRLDDRFSLLSGGRRTAMRRQQTLRAMVDWSHDLLSAGERRLLRRLAVFAGGWTLEVAEAVCSGDGMDVGDVLDLLTGLVDKSLVTVEPHEHGERYRFLETLRQYAEEKLVEAGEAIVYRNRQRDWLLTWLDGLRAETDGPSGTYLVEPIFVEWDNLRAGLAWSQAQPEGRLAGLRLAYYFGTLSVWRSFNGESTAEALGWLKAFLSLVNEPSEFRGEALTWGSTLARLSGDYALSLAWSETALAMYRDLGVALGVSEATDQIGLTLAEAGRSADAIERIERAVAIRRAEGNRIYLADGLRDLGLVLTYAGKLERARPALEESLKVARAIGYSLGVWRALLHLGNVERIDGRFSRAEACFEQWLALDPHLAGDRRASALPNLDFEVGRALLLAAQGDRIAAGTILRARLRSQWRRGDVRWSGTLLCARGVLAGMNDDAARAVRLIGAGAATNPGYASVQFPSIRVDVERTLAGARSALGAELFDVAWMAGQDMPLDEAIELALAN